MHVTFAFQHLNEGFKLEVSSRRHQIFFVPCDGCTIFNPGLLVIARAREGIANHFFHAHPSCGIRRCCPTWGWKFERFGFSPNANLIPRGVRENKLFHRPPVFDFYYRIESPNGIGGPMQKIQSGYPAGQFAIEINIKRIERVTSVGH